MTIRSWNDKNAWTVPARRCGVAAKSDGVETRESITATKCSLEPSTISAHASKTRCPANSPPAPTPPALTSSARAVHQLSKPFESGCTLLWRCSAGGGDARCDAVPADPNRSDLFDGMRTLRRTIRYFPKKLDRACGDASVIVRDLFLWLITATGF